MAIDPDDLVEELKNIIRALQGRQLNEVQASERLFGLYKQTSPIPVGSSSSSNLTCPHCGKSVSVTLS
jgi:hypothetical protein